MAALGMGLALALWMQGMAGRPAWLIAFGGVALGGVVYGLGAWALRVPEVRAVLRAARRFML